MNYVQEVSATRTKLMLYSRTIPTHGSDFSRYVEVSLYPGSEIGAEKPGLLNSFVGSMF